MANLLYWTLVNPYTRLIRQLDKEFDPPKSFFKQQQHVFPSNLIIYSGGSKCFRRGVDVNGTRYDGIIVINHNGNWQDIVITFV